MENERIPILLIEDSPTDAFLYCEALEGAAPASFRVTIAERLDLGLEQLKAHNFEAILLDLGLPDSQGLDTFRAVYKEHPGMPIIILSGWADEVLALEAVQAGAQDYLAKGKISRESVVRVVRYAIQRQRSQVALRESENRFRNLFEHAPVAYLSLDAEGCFIDFNTQSLELLGFEPQELYGRSFGELWSPETRAAFPGKFARFKRDGKINADLQLLKKDGTLIEAALEGDIQDDTEGQFVRAHCILHDITERKIAEQAIRESQERFGTVFRSSPIGIFISTTDGTIIDSNQAFLDMFGYTRAQVIGHSNHDLKLWDDPGEQNKLVKLLGSQGEVSNRELKYRTKDGELGEALAFVELIELAGKQCLLIMLHDITERRRADKALSESEARMKSIFQAAPIGIGLVSERVLLEVNDKLCKLVGYSRDELIGKNARILYPSDEEYSRVGEEKYRQIDKQGTGSVETLFKCKDGRIKNVLLSSTPYDPANLSAGVTFTVLDMTERKKIEKQLHYQANLLENVSDAVISTDNDFIIVTWNQAAERLYGWHAEEAIGKNFGEVVPTKYIDVDGVDVLAEFRKDGCWQGEVIQQNKNGDECLVFSSVTATLDHEEIPVGAIAVNRDITERKQAEENLRENQERYQKAQAMGHVGNWEYDPVTTKFWGSDEAKRIYGFDLDTKDFSTENVEKCIPERERVHQVLIDLIEQDSKYDLVFDILTHDKGMRKTIHSIAEVERDSQGTPLKVTGVIIDITEHKQVEDELHRRAEELAALQATVLEITTPQDLPDLLQSIVERAIHLLDADSGGMYLCDSDRREVNCVVSHNTAQDYTGTVLKYGEGAAGTVAQSGQPLLIDDYSTWPGRAAVYAKEQSFRAVCSVPMTWNNQVTGVIHVLRTSEDNTFTQADLALLTLFANHAAIAVENTRLLQQSKLELAERKQVEAALRESEERYRLLFENLPIGVYRSTPGGQILEANPAFAQMLGYSNVEELLTVNVLDIFENPDDRELELSQLEDE